MKPALQFFESRHRRRGVALVLVLAFVVLVTGLVLAFFSRALVSRQVSNSSANQTRADLLARGAIDTIVGDLKQEIATGSTATTVGKVTIFTPKVPANMLPVRSGNPGTPPFSSGNPDPIPNLIRRSVRSDTIVSPGVGSRASAVSSLDPSLNARSVSAARWNAHYLIPKFATNNDDTDPVAAFTPPDWVIVTRGGPVAFTAWDSSLSNSSPSNQGYALGRYAFAIYDEGGLLDVNVAGYPSGLTTAQTGRKGALALADLTQLGTQYNLSQPQIDNIVGWRNFATAQPGGFFDKTSPSQFTFSATSAKNWLDNFVLNNASGFLKVSPMTTATGQTDQALLSRQQLIDLRRSLGFSVNALQYLGTFSRAVNAPSWAPSAVVGNPAGNKVDYAGQAEAASSINRNLPNVRYPNGANIVHYRDDGTIEPYSATQTAYSYQVQSGEPLLQRRFSLAKLAWLAPNGPKSGISAAAIKACFGLNWDNTQWRWDYVGSTGTSPQHSIKTLDQVASESPAREPNFFELLKAGILSGSLGGEPGLTPKDTGGADGVLGDFSDLSGGNFKTEPNMHILQIGANIIDQADADSFPTAIHLNPFGLTGADDLSIQTVYGIENLPYLLGLGAIAVADPSPQYSGDPNGVVKFWLQPEIWNPHQVPATTPPIGTYPSQFRAYAYGAALGMWTSNVTKKSTFMLGQIMHYDDGTGAGTDIDSGSIYFKDTGSAASAFYNTPRFLTTDLVDAQTPAQNLYNSNYDGLYYDHGNPNKFAAFSVGKATAYNPDLTGMTVQKYIFSDAIGWAYYSLQYKGTDTKFHPYSFMARIAQNKLQQTDKELKPGGEVNAKDTNGNALVPATSIAGETVLDGWGAIRIDPRTDRFSVSVQWWGKVNGENSSMNPSPTRNIEFQSNYPVTSNFTYDTGSSPYPGWKLTTLWSINDNAYPYTQPKDGAGPGNLEKVFYSDPDGVIRRGDCYRGNSQFVQGMSLPATGDGCQLYHGDAAVTPVSTITNPGTGSAQARRPVILNRPFGSVGELGYAFRDLPFKSLDFWSPTSADGALLDLFAVNDQPAVVAGQINPSTASAPVLQAIFSGASKNSDALNMQINPTDAKTLAAFSGITSELVANGPFRTRAEVATRLGPLVSGSGAGVAFNTAATATANWANKAHGEAPIRALSDVSNTRTWNLMIDMIAQAGMFPPNANGLNGFIVQAERRYWLHIAIDRFTGKIVDQQLEPVYE